MCQFQYIIIEVSNKGGFAFFECTNGDYGVLEPQNCEVDVNDVLTPASTKVMPCCGEQLLILNGGRQVKVVIDDLNFKEPAYKLFHELSNSYE